MHIKLPTTTSEKITYYKAAFIAAFILLGGFAQEAKAQTCIGPYQHFNGIPGANADLLTAGWVFSGGTITPARLGVVIAESRSGLNVIQAAGAAGRIGYITTPLIQSPVSSPSAPVSFSFYIKTKNANGGTGHSYTVSYSDDGGVNFNVVAPTPTGSAGLISESLQPTVNNTGWQKVTLAGNFPYSAAGYKFRIITTLGLSSAGAVYFDDFSWTSSNPLENKVVVPELGVTVCASTPVNVPSAPFAYEFFDNGGGSLVNLGDSYNINQDNTVVFRPQNPSDKIKITFLTYATGTGEAFVVSDANGVLLTHTGVGMPSTPTYTSTAASGEITLRFTSDGSGITGGNTGFRIKVESIGCLSPGAFAASAPTEVGATLNWTGTAPGFGVYYSESNVAPDGSVISATVTGTSHVINTLSGNKTYFAWVRSNCADGSNSSWVGPVTFSTTCAVQNVPYSESFNGLGGALPNCTSSNDNSWQTTNGNLYVLASNNTTFYTKPINLDQNKTYRITYDYYSTGGTVNYQVNSGLWGSVADYISGHTAGNGSLTDIANFQPYQTGVNFVGFTLNSFTDAPTFFNMDNLLIVEETCFAPATITQADAIPALFSKRVISWPAAIPAPANGYQYFVSTSDTPPSYNATPTGSTLPGVTSVTLTGLGSATQYFVWVRSNCGGQFSVWSDYVDFTTPNNAATIIRLVNTPGTIPPIPSVSGCNITFRDEDNGSTGAASGNYQNNLDQIRTIMPTGGQSLKVVFSAFTTESGFDGLSIYYGASVAEANRYSSGLPVGYNATNCPAGSFYGSHSPGTIYTLPGQGLTFRFRSDYSVRYAGWVASVQCVTLPVVNTIAGGVYNNNCGLTTQIVINGLYFTGATSVTIGGVAAAFVVNSATQITATIPAGAVTGKISVGNDDAVGTSTFTYTINKPAPVTVGVSICEGEPALAMTTSTSCFNTLPNIINGTWAPGDSFAQRPVFSTNSSVCSFATYYDSVRNYKTFTFQVSVTGLYFFEMSNNNNYDGMGYITTSPFIAGNCGSGTFVIGDDDSGSGDEPVMSAVLTAGVTYILFSTTYEDWWFDPGYVYDNFTWTVTPPVGGQLLDTGGQMSWYDAPVGGNVVFTGNSFNPVTAGVLANTNTPNIHKYYAACSSNNTCRTETIFEIKPKPTVTIASSAGGGCVSSSNVVALNATGTATAVTWTANVSNTLFGDATGTVAYVPGVAAETVYVKSVSPVIVTATGTLNGCTQTATTTINIAEAVWNGSWVGAPSLATAVVIRSNYTSSGNLSACNLVVTNGAIVTFLNGHTLILENGLDVQSGSIIFENNASMVQHNDNAVNNGSISYLRATKPIFQYDYTYWSSPVEPQTLTGMSPATRYDKYFMYDGEYDIWAMVPGNTLMEPGRGYIVRAPDIAPFNTNSRNVYTAPFYGIPNNGLVTVAIPGGADQMNLLGNPYPSAISADAFLNANSNLNGTLYFWTHGTPLSGNNYTPNDYAVYNYMGGTNADSEATNTTGKIATAQGFFVTKLGIGNAVFNNAMRIVGDNDQFFRMNNPEVYQVTADTADRHRFWLEISNGQTAYKQALVGYASDATDGLDRKYDGEMVDGSSVSLYTSAGGKKLSIQGLAMPFDTADLIPLGFRANAGAYTIKLADFDGLFAGQAIYLEDKVLNIIHDLKLAPYNFVTPSGTFDTRFVIRFTSAQLGVEVPQFNDASVVVYKNNQILTVQSAGSALETVTIYDIQGRELAKEAHIGDTVVHFAKLPQTTQVLLVKIISSDGMMVTKKVIY